MSLTLGFAWRASFNLLSDSQTGNFFGMGSLGTVFCSMTSEIDPLRALLSLIFNLLYGIFPHLCSSHQKGSNNKGRNLLLLLFSFFDRITMQGVHGWAFYPSAERKISFVLPVLLPESVEHSAPSSSSKTNCFMASCFQKADILFTCLENGVRSCTTLNQWA